MEKNHPTSVRSHLRWGWDVTCMRWIHSHKRIAFIEYNSPFWWNLTKVRYPTHVGCRTWYKHKVFIWIKDTYLSLFELLDEETSVFSKSKSLNQQPLILKMIWNKHHDFSKENALQFKLHESKHTKFTSVERLLRPLTIKLFSAIFQLPEFIIRNI